MVWLRILVNKKRYAALSGAVLLIWFNWYEDIDSSYINSFCCNYSSIANMNCSLLNSRRTQGINKSSQRLTRM